VLDGELDAHSKGQAADALTQALLERPLRIEVDCARLTFLDSSGLHVFTKARAAARESGKVLVLTQVAGAPRRVIEVCGLTELLC
jgi:anti-sigma B factor antagonist